MFTAISAIVIVVLLILIYKAFEDLHESVAMALYWNPDAKISRFARTVYTLMERKSTTRS
jgi:hypothetical protein